MKRLSWFVFLVIITVSCLDQPDCFQLNNNEAAFAFKIIGGGTDAYDIRTIHTSGADGTILIGENAQGSSAFLLPLNPYASEITYEFDGTFGPYGGQGVKKLSLSYRSQIQFVSEDCGERYYFSEMRPVSTDFDSVRVINAVPTQPPSSNFEIFRCPRTDIINIDFVADEAIETITLLPDGVLTVNGTIGSVLLPLDLSGEESDYLFKYQDGTERKLSVFHGTILRTLAPRCGQQLFVDTLGYIPDKTDFATVTITNDSIYDLPTVVNIELTR